jgi:hypothetical protein
MKSWLIALVLAGASALMAGCATPPSVKSQVTTFSEWPAGQQDKTYVFERTKEQNDSLEYRSYENLVRAELQRLGFTEASNAGSIKLKASLDYGISTRDVHVNEPVLLNSPYPYPPYPPYRYGPAWRGYYSPFYDPFWYGPPMVERREFNYQVFTRHLKVTLTQASDGKKIHETTVVSEGTNGSLAAVMPYMVRSAFMDFPGNNGVPRVVELKMTQ